MTEKEKKKYANHIAKAKKTLLRAKTAPEEEPEREREPKLHQFDYLVFKHLANLIRDNVQRLLSKEKDLLILDCGCGNKPYFPFFENISSLYVGIDMRRTKYVDVIGDIEKLAFKQSSFDVVLCTQVLEHTLSPSTLIDEIYRVLKHNGFLFLSTHGVWPVHGAPLDFWRWTDLGLKKILAKFARVEIYECGGSIASLFQIINVYVKVYVTKSRLLVRTRVWQAITLFLNKLGKCLDTRFGDKAPPKIIINYLAVAKK